MQNKTWTMFRRKTIRGKSEKNNMSWVTCHTKPKSEGLLDSHEKIALIRPVLGALSGRPPHWTLPEAVQDRLPCQPLRDILIIILIDLDTISSFGLFLNLTCFPVWWPCIGPHKTFTDYLPLINENKHIVGLVCYTIFLFVIFTESVHGLGCLA